MAMTVQATTRSAFLPMVLAATALAASLAQAVTLDMVTVGNPGNAADTTGYGAVPYQYQIGTFEVTIAQYTEFLNAVARTDTYSLYNASMGTDLNIAGIARTGVSGAYTYSVVDNVGTSGNRPIAYVSWFDAARFANWMQNGQGSGDTETGAYTLGGGTSGNAVARNPGATFYVPTENEWYKAAFYSAVKGGVGSPGYHVYATQSDSVPGNAIGGAANQVNYYVGAYPNGFYTMGGGTYSPSQNYLTDVGSFPGSASFYGTFDQSGDLYEWNDLTGDPTPLRGLRGGSWYNGGAIGVSSSERLLYDPTSEINYIGFRLASPVPVPEPSTVVTAAGALAWGSWEAWRRRQQA